MTSSSNLSQVIVSALSMTYWAAEDFCKKYGKRVITLSDLNCSNNYDGKGWSCNNPYTVINRHVWTSNKNGGQYALVGVNDQDPVRYYNPTCKGNGSCQGYGFHAACID